jgi:protein phosphatase
LNETTHFEQNSDRARVSRSHAAVVAIGTSLLMYAIDGLPWRLPKIGGTMFAALYAAMAVMFVVPLLWQPKLGWLTLWPAVACGIVAMGYAWAGPAVYRRSNGQLTWPARWVLGPVLAGQWVSWLYYARQSSRVDHVADNVWIGRLVRHHEARQLVDAEIGAVVDCCNAFNEPAALREIDRLELPILDLTAPTDAQLASAVEFIEQHRAAGVLVHCKAGYSRSAALVAAWLLSTGRATKVDEATEMIRTARPNVVIRPEIRDALQQWQRTIDGSPTAQSL